MSDTLAQAPDLIAALPRAAGLQALDAAAAQALTQAPGQARPLAVLALDVDHFKLYRDQAGDAAANAVLARLASLLNARLAAPAVLSHLGGDEFIVVLPGADIAAAQALAEALREGVAQGLADVNAPVPLTITLGVAATPADTGWSARALLSLADARMTFAKKRLTPHHNLVWAGSLPSDWYARLDVDPARWPSL